MRKNIIKSISVILIFIIALYGRRWTSFLFDIHISDAIYAQIYSYFWWIIPSFLFIAILFKFKNSFKILGLNRGFLKGFLFSLATVMPMILSSAFIGKTNTNLELFPLLKKTIFAGLFEEFLFRGFLFGILFRKLKWGFIPASLLGAFIFGANHIYQGNSLNETIGIFIVTGLGAVWFAWLYIEWDANLWIPIFLHSMMNFSWMFFDVSNNALGNIYLNIFRAITIASTIIITIIWNKKRGLNINKSKLLINNG